MFLSVLYACVFYFSICTCSAQLSMFHMEKRSRNTLIIIIIIMIIIEATQWWSETHCSSAAEDETNDPMKNL